MENWKMSIQETPPDILDDPARASAQANYKPHPHFAAIIQELMPFANVLDIKPYYEKLMITLNKEDADTDEIAMASILFLYAVGSVLVDGHPVAKMAKAGKQAAKIGFELAPKIVSAVKKIEKAPFELKSKAAKQGKDLPFQLKPKTVKLAKELPFVVKSKAAKQGKDLPFELKPKGFGRFDLKPKE